MNRFKFRHYNKLANEYTYYNNGQLQVCINKDFESGLIFPIAENNSMYMGTYNELQQCTGYKDEKGKDIYEGDILKEKYKDGETVYEDYTVVKWDKICAGYVMYRPNYSKDTTFFDEAVDDGDNTGILKNFEVVGNIFENPDLFKEIGGKNE